MWYLLVRLKENLSRVIRSKEDERHDKKLQKLLVT